MSDWRDQLKEMTNLSCKRVIKVEVYENEDDIRCSKKICDADLEYFYDIYGLMRVKMFNQNALVKRRNWYALFLEPLVRRGDCISRQRDYYIVKNNNGA
jgi:hypothetical protein